MAGQGGTETVTVALDGYKLTGIYVHPDERLPTATLQTIFDSGSRHLVAGDFNAIHPTWSKGQTNQRGRALCRLPGDLGLLVMGPDGVTSNPTGQRMGSTIDIIVNKGVDSIRNIEAKYDLSSDHWPVAFETGNLLETENRKYPPRLQQGQLAAIQGRDTGGLQRGPPDHNAGRTRK